MNILAAIIYVMASFVLIIMLKILCSGTTAKIPIFNPGESLNNDFRISWLFPFDC